MGVNGHRQNLAWAVLVTSFFLCLGLVLAIPLGINTLIQQSNRRLDVTVQANEGTVGILQGDNETIALFAGDLPYSLNSSGLILTNTTDTALILTQVPREGVLVGRIQVYGNTSVKVDRATTPRFRASDSVSFIELTLNSGRLLLSIPTSLERPLEVRLNVPQGDIIISQPGQYSVTAAIAETQVGVLQGEASIQTEELSQRLGTDERGVLHSSGVLDGPLSAERNLIDNGDFSLGTDGWVKLAPNIEIAGQPTVETKVVEDISEPTLDFNRFGIGHADYGLRQIINQDVTDFESLYLLFNMHIEEQSLGVCGQQGSECPLTVRIEYVDVNGVDQIWQQGFYALGDVGPSTPDVCVACPPPLNEHQRVPFRQQVFFESDNLMEKLGQLGIKPRQIKSVTITASGHTFIAGVYSIALMAKE